MDVSGVQYPYFTLFWKALNINKQRFSLVASIGSIGLIILLLILFMTRTAFAAFPIAGVGGFVVEATKITGTGLKIFTDVGPTSQHENWGQARVELSTADITGLHLAKNIDLGGSLSSYGVEELEIVVEPKSGALVKSENLTIGTTGITATGSDFRTLRVDENSQANNPLEVFQLAANNITLDNAKINTHLLKAESIGIPGLKVKLILKDVHGNIISGNF